MTDESKAVVPVWALATGGAQKSPIAMDGPMTTARLAELRGVLAGLAEEPIATLEAYPMPQQVDLHRGLPLDATSPLAQHLSQLITQSGRGSSVAQATANAETLFRMVVPAKFASEFSQGIVGPMASKAASAGGVYSALRDGTGVVAHATFVPVGEAAMTAGGVAAGGAAAGTAVAGGLTLAVAAPLVLMAVAVGASVAAEHQRQQAIAHITELLEQLHEEKLNEYRSELDGCRDAIDKATAVVLDEGKIGVSLGLDSAVYEIGKALAAAEHRLAKWVRALDELPDVNKVDIEVLTKAFPGIDDQGGTFRGHLELAALAIALKRRVILLQAVEHAQLNPGNTFENFTRILKVDQRRLDQLESDITDVLLRLSSLQVARPGGLRSPVVTSGEADRLLRTAYRIRGLAEGIALGGSAKDVAIEIARHEDGSVVVFPAQAA